MFSRTIPSDHRSYLFSGHCRSRQLVQSTTANEKYIQLKQRTYGTGNGDKFLGPNEFVRDATMNDFKDIMNIHYDVKYAGDRVPYYFPLWLEDPTCYPYVYEVENKIVGFTCLKVIDNGNTGCFLIIQILKTYRGKCIFEKMCNSVMKNHCHISTFVAVAFLQLKSRRDFLPTDLYTTVTVQKVVTFQGRIDQFNELEDLGQINQIHVFDKSDLQNFMYNKWRYPLVFKNKRILVNVVPYKLLESNIPLICSNRTKICASCIEDPNMTLLTFGTHYQLNTGEIYCKLHMNGTINDCFPSQILAHFQAFKHETTNIFIVEVTADNIDEHLRNRMIDIGLKYAPTDVYGRTDALVGEFGYPIPSMRKLQTSPKL